jgi:hypothetical protein
VATRWIVAILVLLIATALVLLYLAGMLGNAPVA